MEKERKEEGKRRRTKGVSFCTSTLPEVLRTRRFSPLPAPFRSPSPVCNISRHEMREKNERGEGNGNKKEEKRRRRHIII